jgi:hypothetical protein
LRRYATVLCTHGLTLRLFLMRWFHWTVAEYERIANPANSTPIILERIEGWAGWMPLFTPRYFAVASKHGSINDSQYGPCN